MNRISVLFAIVLLTALPMLSTYLVHATDSANFSGSGTIHVVVRVLSSGEVQAMSIPTDFSVTATSGGPALGTLALTLMFSGMTLKADSGASDPVGTGLIRVTPTSATGGGTLSNTATGYMSQFGFGVVGSTGQFQCQNTGRSADVMNMPMRMLLGQQVDVLQMDVHGTVNSSTLS